MIFDKLELEAKPAYASKALARPNGKMTVSTTRTIWFSLYARNMKVSSIKKSDKGKHATPTSGISTVKGLENLEELEKTGPCPCLLSSSNSAPNEVANGSFARVDLIRVGGSCGVVT